MLCPVGAIAQIQRKTFHDPEKTRLHELYYVRDTVSNILEGPYRSYYLNGEPESRGQFSNNEASGVWEFFYETGILKTRAQVKTGQGNDGYYEYFYENGEKSMEGHVENQKQTGPWKFYFESGEIKEKGGFMEGERNGEWVGYFEDGLKAWASHYNSGIGKREDYYPSGKIKAKGPVKGKRKFGLWQYFDQSGRKQAEGTFSADKRNGEWVFYHANGEIASRGSYDDNVAIGVWDYYDKKGNITSRGSFENGEKEGNWEIYYPTGALKGSADFEEGSGPYKEFYPSGKLRASGFIRDGLSEGEWTYYFEDGDVEGKCTFEKGVGTYTGFYRDGNIQTRGTIENGKRVGKWEIFNEKGNLTGYYNPIYQDGEIINLPEPVRERTNREYGVADYKFKGSKDGYFDRQLNEFNGLILESNPLLTLIGRFPISLELYMEERLGYQLNLQGIRDPFFKDDGDIALNETFERGYQVAIQQRFYHPSQFGLWYFGHELRFTNLQHYARVELNPGEIDKITAQELRLDYSGLIGYRIMGSTNSRGFTVDTYVSVGVGIRNFDQPEYRAEVFENVDQDSFDFRPGFGLTIGYVFPFNASRRR